MGLRLVLALSEAEGWLLDVYVQAKNAVLWIKTDEGKLIRLLDDYSPVFYIKARGLGEEWELSRLLSESQAVNSFSFEEKYISLDSAQKERLMRVEATGIREFNMLVKGLRSSRLVSELFDVDLRHVQKYLFTRLRIEPTSRVKVGYERGRILWISKVDDLTSEEGQLKQPPFSMARLEYDYQADRGRRLNSIRYADSSVSFEFRGEPDEIAYMLKQVLDERDPDIIICPKCDQIGLDLFKEAGITFARYVEDGEQVRSQGSWGGRIIVGERIIGHPTELWGIAGMVERARFSFLPLGLASRWLSNRSIDSRNCYELARMGYAIPKSRYYEPVRRLEELMERDRGGITITPVSGKLHSNVAALDFDSQYPNIMLKGNLSYERPYWNYDDSKGLISVVMEPWLKRRLRLKKLKQRLAKGSRERIVCEQMIDALKLILVTQYGISGCCWNRFGNVLTFEEINRRSREMMLIAKAVAEENDFEIIYSDVDSLFVKKKDATKNDYEQLANLVSEATGLPMSLDKHFRFIAFPRLKKDGSSSALKRYFGITYDGEVEARGIELRREDMPEFVRDFQRRLIITLMNRRSEEDVISNGLREAKELLEKSLKEIMEGRVDVDSLFVLKRLRKPPEEYKNRVAHLSAALQLLGAGKEVFVGDGIRFLMTDVNNKNPVCRVRAEANSVHTYDRSVYCRMIVEAARTVFHAAGFPDPTVSPKEGATLLDWQ